MSQTSLERVVLGAYAQLVKQIDGIDQAMQKEFGISRNFDIRKVTPQDMAYAEQRIHKEGEKVPCRICVAEAMQNAMVKVRTTQATQQGG